MSDFDTLCRVLEGMDPDRYNEIILSRSEAVLSGLRSVAPEGIDVVSVFADFILCAVSADGVLTEEEHMLAKPILDMMTESDTTYADALEFFRSAGLDSPEGYRATMDAVADMLGAVSPELKDDIVLLCMMVCAVDGRISDEERDWIRRLVE